jgi:hypothetical protein
VAALSWSRAPLALDRTGISERVTGKRFLEHGVASVPE